MSLFYKGVLRLINKRKFDTCHQHVCDIYALHHSIRDFVSAIIICDRNGALLQ
jgi:hypothetical protein